MPSMKGSSLSGDRPVVSPLKMLNRSVVGTTAVTIMSISAIEITAPVFWSMVRVPEAIPRRQGGTAAIIAAVLGEYAHRGRSKEQHFALHLLRDPKVPLVSLAGLAGTGKTYLAIAAGLDATLEHRAYDRVLVFRPVVPVGRQDLGFLPGDVDEKITPWMKAIYDVLAQLFRGSHDADRRESYVQDLVQGLLDDGTVQLEPLTFIRGRTFVRTFAILDEAQNVEYGVLRSLASRLGEGSKLVLCHDTTQVDHPYVDPDSGVAALVERLKGEPHVRPRHPRQG